MKQENSRRLSPGALLHGSGGEEAAPSEREIRYTSYDAAKQTRA